MADDHRGGALREERTATSDSVQSQNTAVSRDSIMSMSSKLLSMESELDKTLRDLDGGGADSQRGGSGSHKRTEHSKSPHHSRSPSASYRYSARSVHRAGAGGSSAGGASGSSRAGGQRRAYDNPERGSSGSFDPLASSRRSGSVDPASRAAQDTAAVDPRTHLDLKEK